MGPFRYSREEAVADGWQLNDAYREGGESLVQARRNELHQGRPRPVGEVASEGGCGGSSGSREKPPAGVAASSAASAAGGSGAEPSNADQLASWLVGLETKSGALEKYVPELQRNFSSLTQLREALVAPHEQNRPVLDCIEPQVFDALGVQSLGHKLLIAKGIIALCAEQK